MDSKPFCIVLGKLIEMRVLEHMWHGYTTNSQIREAHKCHIPSALISSWNWYWDIDCFGYSYHLVVCLSYHSGGQLAIAM